MHEPARTYQELSAENALLKRRIRELERSEQERERTEEAVFLNSRHTQALLKLGQMTEASLKEITDFTLEQSVKLTRSKIGYLAFLNEDESVLTMHSWSKSAMDQCAIIERPIHYPVAGTGLWGEAVRQRRPVITNDYAAPHPWKKGYPEGHVRILRHLNVPVFDGTRMVIVAGVGNKDEDYAETDVQQMTLLIQGMWRLIDRKQAEQALRESEERYRNMVENIEDGYFEVDTSGNLTFFNEPLRRIFAYSRAELLGMNNRHYTATETAKTVFKAFNEMYRTSNPVKILDYEVFRKDGSIRHLEVSSSLMRDNAGALIGFRGIARDVTERYERKEEQEKLREQLRQAQKMESIGTLAGGIAHDFNNLLMGIQGYASLSLMSIHPSHPNYERLKRIEEQVQSGADLTRQLLGFARGGRYEVRPTDMNEILDKSSSMFGRTKKEIAIHCKYAPDLWVVEADRGQMEQVFMNLFVNAWQAMPGGGTIYLETEKITLDEGRALSAAVGPGKYVKISVADTGIGMDGKTMARIFDPFFTTKAMGRGTGLGLATVYGIIKGHGGLIDVDSEPGRGTKFTILLPASEKEVMKEKEAAGTIARGTETILLVEDEKAVLEVSRELLESMGYLVYAVGSGPEAISIYGEKRDEIDVVILDMVMPGMSGGETFDRLREIDSGVKVLLSSGYSIAGRAQEILDRGCNGFLQKPFHPEDLSRKVREMLD